MDIDELRYAEEQERMTADQEWRENLFIPGEDEMPQSSSGEEEDAISTMKQGRQESLSGLPSLSKQAVWLLRSLVEGLHHLRGATYQATSRTAIYDELVEAGFAERVSGPHSVYHDYRLSLRGKFLKLRDLHKEYEKRNPLRGLEGGPSPS